MMKMKKNWIRSIAGILSFLVGFVMFNMPVYADNYGFEQYMCIDVIDNSNQTVLSDSIAAREAGWYKQEVHRGSAKFEKMILSSIFNTLIGVAPGVIGDALEDVAQYFLDNHYESAYYIKYLNSQVVDKCTQNLYYTYEWYSDSNYTNLVGISETGIETVNLCRR